MGFEEPLPPRSPPRSLRMKIPVIRGVIDRRILVNYRVDPSVLAGLLPEPFRPKLVNGAGMAGVCLIRLKEVRPRFLPPFLGLSSENAAHRIAVEWDRGGERREGVFVPRRDTSSRINAAVGGRLFPGEHHHATFRVEEGDDHYRIALDSDDRQVHLLVEGRVAAGLPEGRSSARSRRLRRSSSGARWATRRRRGRASSTVWNCGAPAGASSPWRSGGWSPASSTTGPGSPPGRSSSTAPC